MADLVSIVLPVFNGEKFICATIESLLNQSYSDIELIIVDDASTDATSEVVSRITDPRVKFCRLKNNLGIARALNYGLSIASGVYIARADADDYSEPDRLAKQIDFLITYSNCDIVGTYQKIVGGYKDGFNRTAMTNSQIQSSLLFGPTMLHSTVVFRRNLLNLYGLNLYDPNAYLCEDYDLWVRLSKTCQFENIPEYLCHYHWDQPKNWETNNPKLVLSLEKIWSLALSNFLIYRPGKATLKAHKILCHRLEITPEMLPMLMIHSTSLIFHSIFRLNYSFKSIFLYVFRNSYSILREMIAKKLKKSRS